jgi:hypothetical protein
MCIKLHDISPAFYLSLSDTARSSRNESRHKTKKTTRGTRSPDNEYQTKQKQILAASNQLLREKEREFKHGFFTHSTSITSSDRPKANLLPY